MSRRSERPPGRPPVALRPSTELVDEALVERAVEALRRIVVAGHTRILIETGEYLLKNFYAGDDEIRDRHPKKSASLQRLGERADEYGMTPLGLWRSVRVALNARVMGARIAHRLRQEHHLALIPLDNPAELRMLAESAVEEGWSGRVLKEKVAELHRPHAGGRPPDSPVSVLLRRVGRVLAEFDEARLDATIRSLRVTDARHLAARAREAERRLARIQRALAARRQDRD